MVSTQIAGQRVPWYQSSQSFLRASGLMSRLARKSQAKPIRASKVKLPASSVIEHDPVRERQAEQFALEQRRRHVAFDPGAAGGTRDRGNLPQRLRGDQPDLTVFRIAHPH